MITTGLSVLFIDGMDKIIPPALKDETESHEPGLIARMTGTHMRVAFADPDDLSALLNGKRYDVAVVNPQFLNGNPLVETLERLKENGSRVILIGSPADRERLGVTSENYAAWHPEPYQPERLIEQITYVANI